MSTLLLTRAYLCTALLLFIVLVYRASRRKPARVLALTYILYVLSGLAFFSNAAYQENPLVKQSRQLEELRLSRANYWQQIPYPGPTAAPCAQLIGLELPFGLAFVSDTPEFEYLADQSEIRAFGAVFKGIGPASVPFLLRLLADRSLPIAELAATWLAELPAARAAALSRLVEISVRADTEVFFAAQATQALFKLAPKQAQLRQPFLQRLRSLKEFPGCQKNSQFTVEFERLRGS